jgi:hypothetical protein
MPPQDYYPPNDNLPTGLFLSAEDVAVEYARPALWGAAGTIVWGASECVSAVSFQMFYLRCFVCTYGISWCHDQHPIWNALARLLRHPICWTETRTTTRNAMVRNRSGHTSTSPRARSCTRPSKMPRRVEPTVAMATAAASACRW